MHCPNCSGESFDGITCFQCGYGPPCGPLSEEPEGLPEKVLTDLANMQQVVEETWKELCPRCSLRMFDGWNCANLLCRYSIPEQQRKMQPRIMSPDESERFRQQLGIS